MDDPEYSEIFEVINALKPFQIMIFFSNNEAFAALKNTSKKRVENNLMKLPIRDLLN